VCCSCSCFQCGSKWNREYICFCVVPVPGFNLVLNGTESVFLCCSWFQCGSKWNRECICFCVVPVPGFNVVLNGIVSVKMGEVGGLLPFMFGVRIQILCSVYGRL
jgi:hypothetical protein